MQFKRRLLAFSAIVLCAPAVVRAAEPTAATEATSAPSIGDVVVTARRRAESQQNVPLSVVALSQSALTAAQVHTPADLGKVAPGLVVVAGSGNPAIVDYSIRGRGLNFGAAAGSVETYFEEVPLSAPFQMPNMPAQLFDVSSVQVLKGPQGTLFGRSTTGGAVVVQPTLPTNRFEGYGRVGIGDFNAFQAEGAVNIPLIEDKLALRISGLRNKRDGYLVQSPTDSTGAVINESRTGLPISGGFRGNNIDSWDVRGILRFTPTEQYRNNLVVAYHWDKSLGMTGPGLIRVGAGAIAAPGFGTYTVYNGVSPQGRGPNWSYALIDTAEYDLTPDLKLRNIVGFIHAQGNVLVGQDSDGTPSRVVDNGLNPRDNVNDQITEEFQAQGKAFDSRLDYTVGGLIDLTREPRQFGRLDRASQSVVGNSTITGAGIPLDAGHPNAAGYRNRYQSTDINSYAIYGAGNFKITQQLNFSFGYRHTWDTVTATQASSLQASYYTPEIFQDADPLVAGFQQSKDFRAVFGSDVYNVGLEYHPTSRIMLYAGLRHGFKRGGFNSSALPPAPADFGAEQVDSFSLGAKTEFTIAGMPTRLNVEGFYDNYKGFQASYLGFAAGSLITVTTNIPKVRYTGVDVDFSIRPAQFLAIDLTYTHLDPKITDFPDPTSPAHGQLSANEVPYASHDQLHATFRLHGDLPGSLGDWAVAPSVTYQSKFYTTLFNRVAAAAQVALFGPFDHIAAGGATVEDHSLWDLRVEWNHVAGSRVGLAITATNLTNRYYTIGNSGTLNFGFQSSTAGPPRMVVGEVSVEF